MGDSAMRHHNLENTERFIRQHKLVFVLGCLTLLLNGCKRDSESHREVAAPVSQKVVGAESKQTLPNCPDAPYPMLQAKDPATGHHRVFLK